MIGCVVLNYNDADTTLDLLKRIEPMEIIDQIVLVDNKSTDNSLERLKEQESNKVHVVCAKKNGGYGSGNNVGIGYLRKNYSCDYIIIANPDVIFNESVTKKIPMNLMKIPSLWLRLLWIVKKSVSCPLHGRCLQ